MDKSIKILLSFGDIGNVTVITTIHDEPGKLPTTSIQNGTNMPITPRFTLTGFHQSGDHVHLTTETRRIEDGSVHNAPGDGPGNAGDRPGDNGDGSLR